MIVDILVCATCLHPVYLQHKPIIVGDLTDKNTEVAMQTNVQAEKPCENVCVFVDNFYLE